MPHDPDCVFCQIVADTEKCLLLAENPDALAFMDIHPANPGHCLVIPKGHWQTVFDIPPDSFAAVARLVARIATGVQRALDPTGLSLVQANGPAANQTVSHLHVHVLPRRGDDRLLLNWPRTGAGERATMSALAAKIRDHLDRD
ncbi:MAG TPA: HIT family protein [Acetobacteraceae bacterium]|nr:HIT family protein [Acetobacteraceae bacterium]